MDATDNRQELLSLTTEIVASFAGNNPIATTDLPALISAVFTALNNVGKDQVEEAPEAPVPAVPIKKSVRPDYIVCLEDGKKLKMLKRHLATPLRHDAGAVSAALGSAQGLPDGGAGLRRPALGAGQADRSRPQAGAAARRQPAKPAPAAAKPIRRAAGRKKKAA